SAGARGGPAPRGHAGRGRHVRPRDSPDATGRLGDTRAARGSALPASPRTTVGYNARNAPVVEPAGHRAAPRDVKVHAQGARSPLLRREQPGRCPVPLRHVDRVMAPGTTRTRGRRRHRSGVSNVGAGDLLALGFEGTTLPEAIVDLAADAGLGGIVLFTRNCPSLDVGLELP